MDWKDLFYRLGLRGAAWQWRAWRWQRRWDEVQARWRDGRRHVLYRHKICACGALVDRQDRTCLRCGRAVTPWTVQAALRAVGLALPARGPVTALLLAANVVDFAIMLLVAGPRGLQAPTSAALQALGALVPPHFWGGEYWQLITYGYLHIGLLHLAFNMFALSQIGPELERQVGGARFFAVYTLALLGGGAADVLCRSADFVTIAGASGALFGLIGLGMAYAHFSGGALGLMQRNFFIKWAVYSFVFGYMVGADNYAHAGGFVTGAALGWLLARPRDGGDRVWTALAWILTLLTLAAFAGLALGR